MFFVVASAYAEETPDEQEGLIEVKEDDEVPAEDRDEEETALEEDDETPLEEDDKEVELMVGLMFK